MNNGREVMVEVQCRDLRGARFAGSSAVRLGIQKGDAVIDDVPAEGDSVTFTATLRIGSLKTGKPNFLGPYAHGKPDERFLYLCWGERVAGQWDLYGRAKVPLSPLDWNRVNRYWETGEPITLSVAMTDSRGRPACGSVEAE